MKNDEADAGRYVIAVDLGGTNLRAAVVDAAGRIKERSQHPTPRGHDPHAVVDAIVHAIQTCRTGYEIERVGVAIAGSVDVARELVGEAPNLPALNGFNLKQALQSRLSVPVVLENDANAAAVGELWKGAARGKNSIVCLTLGTGVGGGIILNGKLWRGADGAAGEIGHMTIDPESELKCTCGNTGCLELFVSANAITRLTKEQLTQYPGSAIRSDGLTARDVYEAGINGDELALNVFKSVGANLGNAIANLIDLLNPEMIVIGGAVANAWPLFESAMYDEVARRAFSDLAQRVTIVPAKCGGDAGLLGAARLALDES